MVQVGLKTQFTGKLFNTPVLETNCSLVYAVLYNGAFLSTASLNRSGYSKMRFAFIRL